MGNVDPGPVAHLVHVGASGTFRPSGQFSSSPEDVAGLIAAIETSALPRVVLHFHGGLVAEEGGIDAASGLTPVYQQADAYPLSFVWETGVLTTVRDNLTELGGTTLFRKLVTYAIRHALRRVGAEVAGRGEVGLVPLADAEALWRGELDVTAIRPGARSAMGAESEEDWDAEQPALEAEILADVSADPDLADAWYDDAGTELADGGRDLSLLAVAKHIAKIVFRVVRRFIRRRDHGVVATVVEETLRELYLADLGRWAWTGMKNKAVSMWAPNAATVGEDDHVGSYVLALLAELQQRTGIEIHLVGHSAGSIAIAELLRVRRQRHPDLTISSVALLAPAVRLELFAADLAAGDLPRLRVFTMSDESERIAALLAGFSAALGWLYPSSLLYFISGCLEDDDGDTLLLGLQRDLTGLAPYDQAPGATVAEFLACDGRLVLSPTKPDAAAGRRCQALTHQGFDEDIETRASLVHWIKG